MSQERSFTIYLDACCLNRPFDDQAQARVKLESEAVLIILGYVATGAWDWVSSELVDLEISMAPLDRARKIGLLGSPGETVFIEQEQIHRAKELEAAGFRAADALDVACAESAFADVLLTTDDKLLKAAQRAPGLRVTVDNPVTWLREVL